MAKQRVTADYGLPDTPMMQKLREEGREEGREQERRDLLLQLLTWRYGPLPEDITARVRHLTAAQLLDLARALLAFEHASDLEQWLAAATPPDEG